MGLLEGRHIFNLLGVYMSNDLTFERLHIILAYLLLMLGHDLEMACTKFHENRLIIDGEIDEKHALQIYQNNCVQDNLFH